MSPKTSLPVSGLSFPILLLCSVNGNAFPRKRSDHPLKESLARVCLLCYHVSHSSPLQMKCKLIFISFLVVMAIKSPRTSQHQHLLRPPQSNGALQNNRYLTDQMGPCGALNSPPFGCAYPRIGSHCANLDEKRCNLVTIIIIPSFEFFGLHPCSTILL